MATMFGRFEVQNEISKSESALIYKALDLETNQMVALKTQRLAPLGENSAAFVATLAAEGEQAQALTGQNIAQLYGAGEVEGQFCAAMEYVQGNSIANMLAHNEGFSIWDLLDIARQVCAALDTAAKLGVIHSSLEPDKIIVQWDGLVKLTGYGISNMSLISAEAGNGLGRLMPYCSPEQIRGEEMDQRSNLFTVGTILYEMVTGRKAFDADDPVKLVDQVENEMPPEPVSLNAKIHPGVSALIMKALAKDPGQRYATAHDLIEDLEKCKETNHKAPAEAPKKAAMGVKADPAAKAAAAMKFVGAAATAAGPAAVAGTNLPKPVAREDSKPAAASSSRTESSRVENTKAFAASAGLGASAVSTSASRAGEEPPMDSFTSPAAEPSLRSSKAADAAVPGFRGAVMSAAAPVQEPETETIGSLVDPMMSESSGEQKGRSFSEMDELPPLKETLIETRPEPEPEQMPVLQPTVSERLSAKKKVDKPKIQPRELAQKAVKEVVTVPPRLLLYSILGAIAVILVVAVAMYFHVRSEDDGLTAAPQAVKKASEPAPPAAPAPTAQAAPAPLPVAPAAEPEPNLTVRQVQKRGAKHAPAPAPAPVVIPGEMLVDSTPQGVQFEVDGKADASWVTPFNVTGLAPGKHLISASKPGYSSEVRSIDVVSGAKTPVLFHLAPVNALVVINSTPAAADILLDGKPTHKVTPSQFAVEKGTHTVLLKKPGFLDETTTADLGPGQNFQYAPALRALGDSEAIRTVGRFKKLFGGGGESTAGMGSLSIRTKPKGAQVVINQRILDKMSPVDVMMGPGNYVVDITLTGFKPIHKVVNIEKDGKVVVDEVLERE
ncbi:MAG TPA: serine/threonine-protein kinase [Terriglobales bacterium]|nr:serine/threonine-protein kinase [Terriglobales bacterium]